MANINLDGNDNFFGPLNSADSIAGNAGNDTILGGGRADLILGGKGEDDLRGGTGRDTIYGGQDDDMISGGSGADVVSGDAGADTVAGGGGVDTFAFYSHSIDAADTLTDFVAGEEIALIGDIENADGVQNGADVEVYADVNGVNTLIAVVENALEADVDASFEYYTDNNDFFG